MATQRPTDRAVRLIRISLPTHRFLAALCWAAFGLAGCSTIPTTGPAELHANGAIAADYYDVAITTHDGQSLRATVFQPTLKPGQSAPMVLHSHGFGVFRMSAPISVYGQMVFSGEAALAAWRAGYWVVSYDQRGHGDSEGTNRLMSPQHEVRDLSTVIDWSLENLVRISRDQGHDPRVATIGESYSGGAMLLAARVEPRIDAMIPITTWFDFPGSLAPNQVPKSGWLSTLLLVSNTLNPGSMDPIINNSYWQARDGKLGPEIEAYLQARSPKTYCNDYRQVQADTLLIQGFRDVAFPLNEALGNLECLRQSGRDVRLIGTQGGHLLPFTQWSFPTPGYEVEAEVHCGEHTLELVPMVVSWLDAKLRDRPEAAAHIPALCLTQDYDRGIVLEHFPRGGPSFSIAPTRIHSGFTGFFESPLWPVERFFGWFTPRARNPQLDGHGGDGTLRPAFTPLYVAKSETDLVGIPLFQGHLASPEPDPMVFLGIAVKRARGRYYELISDQVTPLRGVGDHNVELMAISTHLEAGDVVGSWLFGYHNQYRFSHTGWLMEATVEGLIQLPLQQKNPKLISSRNQMKH
ncbi:alpha/beta fold hydrolase [Ketobacter sp.]|uniref:alpha/beta fold hydrolase n=1 Tax=Ketobacter sp. TaxID=2083498 RepID=UPI0025BCDB94|nr:alpha/beta fold hydrolase [Ketobacter sp.]